MFFGTARTSVEAQTTFVSARVFFSMERTPFRHLHKKQLLAFLWLSDVCRDERILRYT